MSGLRLRLRPRQEDEDRVEEEAFEQFRQQENIPPPPRRFKRVKRRQCRICLEIIKPIIVPVDPFNLILRVHYISRESPELDPLCSPCLCKGGQKYVHTGCLAAWRGNLSAERERQYWECPTCKYVYDFNRFNYAAWVTHPALKWFFATLWFLFWLYLGGFFGDYLLGLYFDPFGTVWDAIYESSELITTSIANSSDSDNSILASAWYRLRNPEDYPWWIARWVDEKAWPYHFFKGLIAFGIYGFFKTTYKHGYRVLYYNGGGFGRATSVPFGGSRVAYMNWTMIGASVWETLKVSSSILFRSRFAR